MHASGWSGGGDVEVVRAAGARVMATAERVIAGAGLVVEPAATLPQPSAAATIVEERAAA